MDNLFTKDQLEPNVLEYMAEDIGNVNELPTESRTLVSAINEVLGKEIIAKAIGAPLNITDKFSEMGTKIDNITEEFRAKLIESGVDGIIGDEKYAELVTKIINDVKFSKRPSWVKTSTFYATRQPYAKYLASIAYVNGYVYETGGYSSSPLKSCNKYDMITDTWTAIADMNNYHYEHDSLDINDTLYVISGRQGSSTASGICEKYDEVSNSWTVLANIPYAAYSYINYSRGAVLNGRYYRVGFYGGSSGTGYNYTLIYDPLTNTWENKGATTNASYGVVVELNGKLYHIVTGGSIKEYNETNNTLTEVFKASSPYGTLPITGFVKFNNDLYNVSYDGIFKFTKNGEWVIEPIADINYLDWNVGMQTTSSEDFIFAIDNKTTTTGTVGRSLMITEIFK